MNIPDGGPAFPTMGDDFTAPGPDGSRSPKSAYGFEGAPGMSLRDWFAGQAQMALLMHYGMTANEEAISNAAYEHADAMLAEREKKS